MLNQGFKEDIEKIFQHVKKSRATKTQNLMFSATIPSWIWSISDQYQTKNRPFIDLMKDSVIRTSMTVDHFAVKVSPHEKESLIGPIINHFLKGKSGKVIVFC